MTRIYFDDDADMTVLQGKRIGIIGYGNQGRAQALNMRDSGIGDILITTAKDTTFDQAREDGFQVLDIPELVKQTQVVSVLIPDEIMPLVYQDQIRPHLRAGHVLNFASGYNITFGLIVPPAEVDVVMVAPRMIGDGVRRLFLEKKGYPAFLAVQQDASSSARATALALAKAMGATQKGTIEVTFKDETMLDLLAEQAVWPLIISVLTEAFHFEVGKGHPAEASLVELYLSQEAAYMFAKMAADGLFKQLPYHSHTSQYGQLSRAESLDKSFIRRTLADAYDYIERGQFAQEWKTEQEKGMPEFKRLLDQALHSDITRLEETLLTE